MNSRKNGFLYVGVVDRVTQFIPIYLFLDQNIGNTDLGKQEHKKIFLLITLNINSHNVQTIPNFFWQATGNHLKPALQLLIILEENPVYILMQERLLPSALAVKGIR